MSQKGDKQSDTNQPGAQDHKGESIASLSRVAFRQERLRQLGIRAIREGWLGWKHQWDGEKVAEMSKVR